MELSAPESYENHPQLIHAVEKFHADIESIAADIELPRTRIEAIAKKSLSDIFVRSARGPSSWNNFVQGMQKTLPGNKKDFGLNTRHLSTLWRGLSQEEKAQYRRGRRTKRKSEVQNAQLRRVVNDLRRKVDEISKLGADALFFVCDNKKQGQGGGLSSAFGSPQAVRFTQWMDAHRVGLIDFKRFCKGEELSLNHRDIITLRRTQDPLHSRHDQEELEMLSRDASRSRLNASLLVMFNQAVEHHDKLLRLPPKKSWASWMEVRGLELVIENPNITRSDLEERLQGKAGVAKMKTMISGIENGEIRLQNIRRDLGSSS
ncbi:MAG: hypothetical protein M1824_005519 [Vezdaea acicularis]|nr:MAG: hypothetical protein M1824_005519 [Vezdaea acicularis]